MSSEEVKLLAEWREHCEKTVELFMKSFEVQNDAYKSMMEIWVDYIGCRLQRLIKERMGSHYV